MDCELKNKKGLKEKMKEITGENRLFNVFFFKNRKFEV